MSQEQIKEALYNAGFAEHMDYEMVDGKVVALNEAALAFIESLS